MVAVFLMMVPTAIAFPLLGVWSLAKVWPGMSLADRTLLCGALVMLLSGAVLTCRRRMGRIKQGFSAELTPVEQSLIYGPVVAAGWALTHRLDGLLLGLACVLWTVCQARSKRRGHA